MARKLKIPTSSNWEQIDGDFNLARYGGTLARSDGDHIELVKIQPVREYVGDKEAAEVGHPYWTREGYFNLDDLQEALKDKLFMRSMDMATVLEGLNPEQAALAIASSMLDHVWGDEGNSGWAEDIDQGFPPDIVEQLEEEDDEFRREVLGEEDEED